MHERLKGRLVPAAAEPLEQFLVGKDPIPRSVPPLDHAHDGRGDGVPIDYRPLAPGSALAPGGALAPGSA